MNYINAFVIGGLICVIGQLLLSLTSMSPARVLVLFVTAGVVLTAIGVYEPLVNYAKAGATVPLTGFGYALARGALQGAAEKGIIGAFSGGIASTAPGVGAAVFFGYIFAVVSKPKTKS